MWKPDLQAIREAARGDWLMAKTAKLANPAKPKDDGPEKLADLAKLAVRHHPAVNPDLLELPPDLRRLLGLLDHVGGLDLKGIAVAMGEPLSNVIRWTEQAKRRRLVTRSGQWWNLTRQAYQLSVERLEPTSSTSDPEEQEEADLVPANLADSAKKPL
ncbi:MAG TPA: hypothetical protein PKC60_05750 [Hydrogenophaga sp.]|uniref:hypothetical protein n=1 Tax=Hydrogenophaga sp. TaxID=1904254 RepID=UPI002BAFBCF3|nr:hypothetical protein [Hydrogenophaga sp.]HMN92718.1 hypothetical protein [Hydrogenophaga sp.]HMP08876.1 hypothetical protein [Hydrogenophaga sp.]